MSEERRVSRISRRRLLQSAILTSGAGSLALLQDRAPAAAQDSKPVSYATTASNPPKRALYYGTGSVISTLPLFLMGLVKANAKAEMEPWLASSVELNSSCAEVVVKLRPEARWSDGQPVTAQDVVWTWEVYTAPWIFGVDSPESNRLGIVGAKEFNEGTADSIAGVQIIDDHTVVAQLDPPNCLWTVDDRGEWGILPKHLFADLTDKSKIGDHPYMDNPTVTSGPFKFIVHEQDQYIEMHRWDEWWGNSIWKQPEMTHVFAKQIAADTALLQLEQGELTIGGISPAEIERFSTLPHIQIHRVPSLGVQFAFEINGNKPYLQDKRVRQAFDFALDKEAFRQAVYVGTGQPAATSVFGPEWAVHPSLQPRPYDPEQARALLQEVNWNPDQELVYITMAGDGQRAGEVFQQFLADVGVKMTIQVFTSAVIWDVQAEGKWEFAPNGGGFFGRDPSENEFFHSSRGQARRMGVNNPELDQLLEEGRLMLDIEQRAPIYHRAAEILFDEVPWIISGQAEQVDAVNKELGGFVPFPMTSNTTASILDWYWES